MTALPTTNTALLTLATLVLSLGVALLLILAVRVPMRRWFGARLAYGAWWLVPAAMLACLAPAQMRAETVTIQLGHLQGLAAPSLVLPERALDWSMPLLWIWLAGAVAMAWAFWFSHRRFVRGLGVLHLQDGRLHGTGLALGAVSLGLWQPRIIVARQFTTLYTPAEQELIVEHERVHAARRDAWANLFAAVLQCAFWFNPLVHVAALRFRLDQELACDAAVVGSRPQGTRAYATALLKSQPGPAIPCPTLACQWQAVHPLKERIMHLTTPQPNARRRARGILAVACLVVASAVAGLATRASAQAAPGAADFAVATTIGYAGTSTAPHLHAHNGERVAVRGDANGKPWAVELQIERAAANSVWIRTAIEAGGAPASRPTVLSKLGEPARIQVDTAEGPFDLSIVVAALPE